MFPNEPCSIKVQCGQPAGMTRFFWVKLVQVMRFASQVFCWCSSDEVGWSQLVFIFFQLGFLETNTSNLRWYITSGFLGKNAMSVGSELSWANSIHDGSWLVVVSDTCLRARSEGKVWETLKSSSLLVCHNCWEISRLLVLSRDFSYKACRFKKVVTFYHSGIFWPSKLPQLLGEIAGHGAVFGCSTARHHRRSRSLAFLNLDVLRSCYRLQIAIDSVKSMDWLFFSCYESWLNNMVYICLYICSCYGLYMFIYGSLIVMMYMYMIIVWIMQVDRDVSYVFFPLAVGTWNM